MESLEGIDVKPLDVKSVDEVEGVFGDDAVTIDSLKAIIKLEDLGVRVAKDDTIEGVQARIEKARKSK